MALGTVLLVPPGAGSKAQDPRPPIALPCCVASLVWLKLAYLLIWKKATPTYPAWY